MECSPFLPPLFAFGISSLVTSAGVSGAFLILPFQMSVLGFTSPAVSATNLLYNVIAIPGGVSQYVREGRMAWPVLVTTLIGTLPGVFLGAIIRVRLLPDARNAKFFAGLILLWLGYRMLRDLLNHGGQRARLQAGAVVTTRSVSTARIEYDFCGETYGFRPLALVAMAFLVGIGGGVYGIGGGALLAPFLVSVLALPVYTIAGASLLGTFITSIAGVASFELLALTSMSNSVPVRPDWLLGGLFGIGGLAGTFVGARLQKHLPERWIRLLLFVLITGVAISYVVQFFA